MMDQGHNAFKVKTGGLTLAEDIERLTFIRKVIGDDNDLIVDVNRAWDLPTAVKAVEMLEPLRPRWLEELALLVSWLCAVTLQFAIATGLSSQVDHTRWPDFTSS